MLTPSCRPFVRCINRWPMGSRSHANLWCQSDYRVRGGGGRKAFHLSGERECWFYAKSLLFSICLHFVILWCPPVMPLRVYDDWGSNGSRWEVREQQRQKKKMERDCKLIIIPPPPAAVDGGPIVGPGQHRLQERLAGDLAQKSIKCIGRLSTG